MGEKKIKVDTAYSNERIKIHSKCGSWVSDEVQSGRSTYALSRNAGSLISGNCLPN
jgi:hypothetical protein